MNKSIKLGGVFAVVMATAFTISSAMAYQGNPTQEGPDCSPERHAAMEKAMENNNYEAWSELMADHGRVAKVINAGNFSQFAEAYQLAHEGDLESADAIRKDLGLRTRSGEKVGANYKGRGKLDGERRGKMSGENRGYDNL